MDQIEEEMRQVQLEEEEKQEQEQASIDQIKVDAPLEEDGKE